MPEVRNECLWGPFSIRREQSLRKMRRVQIFGPLCITCCTNDWLRDAFYSCCDWLNGRFTTIFGNNNRHVSKLCGCNISGCMLIKTSSRFVQRVHTNSTRWVCGTKGSSSLDWIVSGIRAFSAYCAPPSRCLNPQQGSCVRTHFRSLNEFWCRSSTACSMSPFASSVVANVFWLDFSDSKHLRSRRKKYCIVSHRAVQFSIIPA